MVIKSNGRRIAFISLMKRLQDLIVALLKNHFLLKRVFELVISPRITEIIRERYQGYIPVIHGKNYYLHKYGCSKNL